MHINQPLRDKVDSRRRCRGRLLVAAGFLYYMAPFFGALLAAVFIGSPLSWILILLGFIWIIGNIVVGSLMGCD